MGGHYRRRIDQRPFCFEPGRFNVRESPLSLREGGVAIRQSVFFELELLPIPLQHAAQIEYESIHLDFKLLGNSLQPAEALGRIGIGRSILAKELENLGPDLDN